jgi:NAD(P)H-flavin reductase
MEAGRVLRIQERIKVHYIVDRITGTPKRDYLTGYINEEMVRTCLSTADGEQMDLVLLCGPQVMIDRACLPNLKKAEYPLDKILHF